jgi:signal transduction histidine kinase
MDGVEAMANSVHQRPNLEIPPCGSRSRDPGPAIEFSQTDWLLDAFFTTKPEGMGMGLSICRSFVDAHSGRLSASPNCPNYAVFHFTLTAAVGES